MFEKNLVYLALLFYNAAQNASETFQILHLQKIIDTLSKEDLAFDELKVGLDIFIFNHCLSGLHVSLKNSVKTLFRNSSYDFYLKEVIIRNIKSKAQEGGVLDKFKIIYPIKINLGKYFIYTALNHSSCECTESDEWDILKVFYGIGNEKICLPDVISEEYRLAGPESVVDIIHKVNSKIIGYLKNSNINIPVDIQRELLPINYSHFQA